MRPGTSLTLDISGWQIAFPNYTEADAASALAVSSEGVLSCGETTCSAGGAFFCRSTVTTRPLFSAQKLGAVWRKKGAK